MTASTPFDSFQQEPDSLSHDCLAYDVVYASGNRVQDVLDEALELHESATELLSFSTRVSDIVCRITCLRRSETYACHSSYFIPQLNDSMIALLSNASCSGEVEPALKLIKEHLQRET